MNVFIYSLRWISESHFLQKTTFCTKERQKIRKNENFERTREEISHFTLDCVQFMWQLHALRVAQFTQGMRIAFVQFIVASLGRGLSIWRLRLRKRTLRDLKMKLVSGMCPISAFPMKNAWFIIICFTFSSALCTLQGLTSNDWWNVGSANWFSRASLFAVLLLSSDILKLLMSLFSMIIFSCTTSRTIHNPHRQSKLLLKKLLSQVR